MGDVSDARISSAAEQAGLPADALAAFLAERPAADLEANLEDLALAAAAGAGNERAVSRIDGLLETASRGLSRFGLATSEVDDLMQGTRERLFAGSEPQIRRYGGRGSLLAWLRVVLTRAALDRVREQVPAEELRSTLPAAAADTDLELGNLRDRFREAFPAALSAALASLPARQRNLLRYRYLDDLTVDQIAALQGTHRSTAARRVTEAVDALSSAVRQCLSDRLHIGSDELESAIRVARSVLEVSLREQLGRKPR